jgi:tetratricopeptide (TPR) repeat protein
MPRTVLSIKAEIRDHSMSIPAPENSINHAIPNACNVCHKDRDAQWALQKMAAWYGTASRQKWIRRADAFAAAGRNDAQSIPQLLAILAESREGPLPRANALSHLARFAGDPRIFPAMREALEDGEPLVRAIAALRMVASPIDKPSAIASLTKALADPAATVRIGAAVSLVSLGVKTLPGEDGVRFERAADLYRARAALNIDDAAQQLGAGKFYLLTGDPVRALSALETSLKLDPEIPARYLIAAAYVQQGETAKARAVLLAIPPTDPDYPKSRRLLQSIGQ